MPTPKPIASEFVDAGAAGASVAVEEEEDDDEAVDESVELVVAFAAAVRPDGTLH